jgi:3-oxoacyl-[acyl-carrier-protein] synthase-3
MQAVIGGISYILPDSVLTNEELAAAFPGWTVDKIASKTGIQQRHIAAPEECSSDLAVAAARKLFAESGIGPDGVDYVLFCTQSPDYFLPATACLIQHRLGIPITAGAIDFNQGCSGFVVGLGLAKGLIETGQARRVLLLTAETYSKFIHPADRSIRTLFGDAAAATFVEASDEAGQEPCIGPFVYGTDGRGAQHLIVPRGGMRQRILSTAEPVEDEQGNIRTANDLRMNGAEIFNFTLRTIPPVVQELLNKAGLDLDAIDLFVFHQANGYMLEHLRKKLRIPKSKFFLHLSDCGNTVSSTIPIALKSALDEGVLRSGQRVMVVGFGVGYSWAAALLSWC